MKIDKKYYLFIFLLIFSEIFFFRNILFNDFLFGDRLDGRLTMLITEHWYRFCCGLEKINDLSIFYPVENTLAYSDMLLGYGLIHSFFRFCGIDMFIAYKVTLIFVHLLGVLSLFYFLSKVLNLDYFWGFFGTSAFSFSCTYANQLFHTQLNAISFLPLFLIFFVRAIQNVDNRLKRNIYMYSAIFIIILILYTAWYICFFSALFAFIFIVVGIIFCYIKQINIKNIIKQFGYDIIAYITTTVLLMIPFLLAELPLMKTLGGYPYVMVSGFIGTFYSFIYTPNIILNKFLSPLSCWNIETQMGFSFILFILFIIFIIFLFKQDNKEQVIFYKILSISLIICLLLPVKLPFTDFSLWYFVYKFFISGSSLRAVGRFLFFLSLPMAIITSVIGNYFLNLKNIEGKKNIVFMSILCVLLFCFNINTIGVSSTWSRAEELLSLSYIPNPPQDCKVIYFKNPYPPFSKDIDINTVTMICCFYKLNSHEIAYKFNLKTINGYSGVTPKGYGIKEQFFETQFCYSMENFYSENYEMSILEWIKRYKLENVYSYDIINRKWEKVN